MQFENEANVTQKRPSIQATPYVQQEVANGGALSRSELFLHSA